MVRAIWLVIFDYFWNFLFNTLFCFGLLGLHFMAIVINNNRSSNIFSVSQWRVLCNTRWEWKSVWNENLFGNCWPKEWDLNSPKWLSGVFQAWHNPLFYPDSEGCLLWNTWSQTFWTTSGSQVAPHTCTFPCFCICMKCPWPPLSVVSF